MAQMRHSARRNWRSEQGLNVKAIIALTVLMISSGVSASEKAVSDDSRASDPSEPARHRVHRPLINETVEFYEISGDCEADLRTSLRKNGCVCNDGKKYHSLTSWNFKWDYDYHRTKQSCAAVSFQPIININIRYPKWSKNGNPPAELREKWDAFMDNLVKHEEVHRDMAVEAASEVTVAVMKLPLQATCADLDREIKKIARIRMKQLDEDAKDYDAETKHGLTQGAVFP